MPTLSSYEDSSILKMLLIGDSGTGKTGALASLAQRGYKLRILDFDKGLQPLAEALKKQCKSPVELAEAMGRVEFVSLSDELQIVGGHFIAKGIPKSVQQAMGLMDKWGPKSHPEANELGSPAKWGRDSILVIDSLSHMCNAILRYVQAINANSGKNVTQPEWGAAQRIVEEILTQLYSDDFNTNVIVTAHVTYIQSDERLDNDGNPAGAIKGLPSSLGRALPPKIPQYFNVMLAMETQGMKRVLTTQPNNGINTKNPILDGVPRNLPIETGLADYFDISLGKKARSNAGATPTPLTKPAASTTI